MRHPVGQRQRLQFGEVGFGCALRSQPHRRRLDDAPQFLHLRHVGADLRRYYRALTGGGYTSGAFTFRNTYTRAASDTTNAPR